MREISVFRLDELIFRHAFFAKADVFEAIKEYDGLGGGEPEFEGEAWEYFFLNAAADIWEEIVEPHERPKDYEELLDGGNSDEIYGPFLHEIEEIIKKRLIKLFNTEREKHFLRKLSGITIDRRLDVMFSSEANKRLQRKDAFNEAEKLYLLQNPNSSIDKFDPYGWLEHSFSTVSVINYFKKDSEYLELFKLCSNRIFTLLYESNYEKPIQDLDSMDEDELFHIFRRTAPDYAFDIIQTQLMTDLAGYFESLLVGHYKQKSQAWSSDEGFPF